MDCEVVKLRYYKVVDTGGKLVSIGTGSGGVEITVDEYEELSSEIKEKAVLVSDLAAGKISESEIREDWREEIIRRAETEEMQLQTTVYTEDMLMQMTNAELEQILYGYGRTANMNKENMVALILRLQEEN